MAASPSSTCFVSYFSPSVTSASDQFSAVVSVPWFDPVGVAAVGKDTFYESQLSFPINSTLYQKQYMYRDSHGGLSFVSTPAGSKGGRVVSNAEMNLLQQKTS